MNVSRFSAAARRSAALKREKSNFWPCAETCCALWSAYI